MLACDEAGEPDVRELGQQGSDDAPARQCRAGRNRVGDLRRHHAGAGLLLRSAVRTENRRIVRIGAELDAAVRRSPCSPGASEPNASSCD